MAPMPHSLFLAPIAHGPGEPYRAVYSACMWLHGAQGPPRTLSLALNLALDAVDPVYHHPSVWCSPLPCARHLPPLALLFLCQNAFDFDTLLPARQVLEQAPQVAGAAPYRAMVVLLSCLWDLRTQTVLLLPFGYGVT